MIAVDTNLLVYAHRRDSPWHTKAERAIRAVAEGPASWAIPWPCVHEFLAIVTHPRIYNPPTDSARATDQVQAWIESPSLVLLAEGPGYAAHLHHIIAASKVVGAKVHDARVAALCSYHGIRELWSADRDFSRFTSLKVRNPLVE